MCDPLSYILPLCTIIRPKIRVLINLFVLFVHSHSTKIRGHSYSLIYSFLNCVNISYAIFKAVLPLYSYQYCPYISYAIFMTIWSLGPIIGFNPLIVCGTFQPPLACYGSVKIRSADSTTSTTSGQMNDQTSTTGGQTDTMSGQASTTSTETNEQTSTASRQTGTTSG